MHIFYYFPYRTPKNDSFAHGDCCHRLLEVELPQRFFRLRIPDNYPPGKIRRD